jgi:hypothetical protein
MIYKSFIGLGIKGTLHEINTIKTLLKDTRFNTLISRLIAEIDRFVIIDIVIVKRGLRNSYSLKILTIA